MERALVGARGCRGISLGALQVKTPSLSVDLLLNRWLVYQTLVCRVWGRPGFINRVARWISGSAAGVMAFVYSAPAAHAEADSGGALPAVCGRRCSALVASAGGCGRSYPMLGRYAVAALRGCQYVESDWRYWHSRRGDSVLSRGRFSARASRELCSCQPSQRRTLRLLSNTACARFEHGLHRACMDCL